MRRGWSSWESPAGAVVRPVHILVSLTLGKRIERIIAAYFRVSALALPMLLLGSNHRGCLWSLINQDLVLFIAYMQLNSRCNSSSALSQVVGIGVHRVEHGLSKRHLSILSSYVAVVKKLPFYGWVPYRWRHHLIRW